MPPAARAPAACPAVVCPLSLSTPCAAGSAARPVRGRSAPRSSRCGNAHPADHETHPPGPPAGRAGRCQHLSAAAAAAGRRPARSRASLPRRAGCPAPARRSRVAAGRSAVPAPARRLPAVPGADMPRPQIPVATAAPASAGPGSGAVPWSRRTPGCRAQTGNRGPPWPGPAAGRVPGTIRPHRPPPWCRCRAG